MAGQGMKFLAALGLIVDNLDSDETNEKKYTELGQLHARMGVTAKDFDPMREAFLDTIELVFAEEFTPALDNAWRKTFDQVSAHMIQRGNINGT